MTYIKFNAVDDSDALAELINALFDRDFAIMGAFKKHARRQGFDESEIEAVLEEAMKGDYQHLLATIINHCEV